MTRDEDRFGGPDRAVRAAERVRRRIHLHDRRGHPFFGIVLIALGAIFLLDNLDIVESRFVFRNLWPLLLMVLGGYHVVNGPHTTSRVIGAAILGFGSLLLFDRLVGLPIDAWDLFWPVLLILVGLQVFFKSRRFDTQGWEGPPPSGSAPPPPVPDLEAEPGTPPAEGTAAPPTDGRVDSSSTFTEVAILAGIERRNISQTFRGGEATAIMGGVEIDLRECRMSAGEAYLDVLVIMGSVELRIPKEWTVESRVTALLAGVEDRSGPPVAPAPPRLVVRGTVFLGSIEIRN